jgi:hypothetical protein
MRTPAYLALIPGLLLAAGCDSRKADPAAQATRLADGTGDRTGSDRPAVTFSGETVENPQYRSWAAFKPGTTVTRRTTTEATGGEGKTLTTTTDTLLEVTDAFVKIRTQSHSRRYDGYETRNPPDEYKLARLIPLPPGVSKEQFGKPAGGGEQGEETVTVAGKEYRTRWHKGKDRNEAGEVEVRVWSSDEVPGGLVKSVTRIPAIGKTTTIELVEVKAP